MMEVCMQPRLRLAVTEEHVPKIIPAGL